MWRCELIARFTPQDSSVETGMLSFVPMLFANEKLSGVLYLQFSMMQGEDNQLNSDNEHQLVFFESHFCDIQLLQRHSQLIIDKNKY
jgi:hypothetical protein